MARRDRTRVASARYACAPRAGVHRIHAVAVSCALFGMLTACHRPMASVPSTSANVAAPLPTLPPMPGHAIGDPAASPVRVISLDTVKEIATISLDARGNLIVLEVMPGRDIEVLYPSAAKPATTQRVGHVSVDLGRYEKVSRYTDAERAARARQVIADCETRRAAAARRAAAEAARAVRRDSSGKIVSTSTPTYADSRDDLAPCDRLTPNARGLALLGDEYKIVRLPPRTPSERYLVALASQTPISLVEINQRLAGFTAVAPDVASTIEAIATGIFAGRESAWTGYYVSW